MIRTKIGVFNYAPHRIVFDPTKIDHYVNEMIRKPDQSGCDDKGADQNNIEILHSTANENESGDESPNDTICADCENPENAFILPCEVPHILVWAKYQYLFYRPAKVMFATYKGDNVNVCVRFFGDHIKADVSDCDCYILSEEYPDDSDVSLNETYALSLKVG